ncbi:phosphotransferase [Laceyella putida]|uniref:Phosphotransferase n=1 Tax=Laceyella putida TaxID=110101 RepID=A0ABW2RFF7_9BACL
MSVNEWTTVLAEWTGEERLLELLAHHYGLEVTQAQPMGGVLKLHTDQGAYVLKRVRMKDQDRWKLLDEVATYLTDAKKSVRILATPVKTNKGQLVIDGYRFRYVLLPWIEAAPVQLNGKEDWIKVARHLAEMHQSSKNFAPGDNYREYEWIGHWQERWQRDLQHLNIFQTAAKWTVQPNELDHIWLDISRFTIGMMENLLEYYQKIGGDKLATESSTFGKIRHGRLRQPNILKGSDGTLHLVDWNELALDVRAADVAQLLLYAYGRTGSPEILEAILEGYQTKGKCSQEEFALIYARLLFPEKLIRLLENTYLNQGLSLDEAVKRVRPLLKIEEKKIGLLQTYHSILKQKMNVSIPQLDWIRNEIQPS